MNWLLIAALVVLLLYTFIPAHQTSPILQDEKERS